MWMNCFVPIFYVETLGLEIAQGDYDTMIYIYDTYN